MKARAWVIGGGAACVAAIAGCTALLDTGSLTERGTDAGDGLDSTIGDGAMPDAGALSGFDAALEDATPADGSGLDGAGDAGVDCAPGTQQCATATSIVTCEANRQWGMPMSCPSNDAGVSPYVCERYDDASCADPSWAEWPMPNSSIDSPPAPNPQSYTDNLDGTVTDNVTGLMWEQASSPGALPWGSASAPDTAQSYCATLSTGGHVDWRLPSVIELVSIVDLTVPDPGPSISATYFPNTPPQNFWSATVVAGSPGSAWFVSFYTGVTFNDITGNPYDVRCVR